MLGIRLKGTVTLAKRLVSKIHLHFLLVLLRNKFRLSTSNLEALAHLPPLPGAYRPFATSALCPHTAPRPTRPINFLTTISASDPFLLFSSFFLSMKVDPRGRRIQARCFRRDFSSVCASGCINRAERNWCLKNCYYAGSLFSGLCDEWAIPFGLDISGCFGVIYLLV